MPRLAVIALLAALSQAATLTTFIPSLPLTFEENRGQLSHPATHIAADHGWAFSCSTLYRRSSDWYGPDRIPAITLLNANLACQPSLSQPATAIAHYYRGPNRAQWVESVPRFHQLSYRAAAQGLDAQFRAAANTLEWRWDVAAGLDPSSFFLSFVNAAYLYTNDQGLHTSEFGLIPHPTAVQLKRQIPARWLADPETKTARIVVDTREPMAPLSITISLPAPPPALSARSTRDPAGNWLLVSASDSLASLDARTETCNISQWPHPCPAIVATRFSPQGDLLSETHLAGARYQSPSAIRADQSGNFYVAGSTYSTDFPVTEDAAQRNYLGPALPLHGRFYQGGDAVVAKLYGPNGALISSTYAGTARNDFIYSFDVDSSGRPLLLLNSASYSGPMPVDVSRGLLRLNEPFSRFDIEATVSPTTLAARASGDDSVWLLDNSKLDHLDSSGQPVETIALPAGLQANSLAVAPGPALWLSAWRDSEPVLARIASDVTTIRAGFPYGTLEADAAGNVSLFAAYLSAPDLPVTPDALLPEPCAESSYYARFTPSFDLTHATFLPLAGAMTLDATGAPILTVESAPALLNLNAPPRPFLACIDHTVPNTTLPLAPASLVTFRGRDIGPATPTDWQLDATGKIATTLASTTVTFAGIPAPILRAEPNRIDVIVPHAAPTETAISVQIARDGATLDARPSGLAPRSFVVFRVENEDGSINSQDNPARLGSTIRLLGSGAGPTNPPGVDGQVGHPTLAVPQAKLRAQFVSTWLDPIRFNQAPEWTSGIMEAVFQLPAATPPSAQATQLLLELGGFSTQQYPWLWFK